MIRFVLLLIIAGAVRADDAPKTLNADLIDTWLKAEVKAKNIPAMSVAIVKEGKPFLH